MNFLNAKIFVRSFILKIYYLIRRSNSQYGEDLVLNRLLKKNTAGFYVDVGANDPIHFNNTIRFYKKGWVGINIEPQPILYKKVSSVRQNDINLNIGVGPIDGEMPFYVMSADTLSTFNKAAADHAVKDGHQLLDTIIVPVIRLDTMLEKYSNNRFIDFMSIDVEGFEMQVLMSNNWNKFRPKFLIIEINQNGGTIKDYIYSLGYLSVFDNGTNCIFEDKQAPSA